MDDSLPHSNYSTTIVPCVISYFESIITQLEYIVNSSGFHATATMGKIMRGAQNRITD